MEKKVLQHFEVTVEETIRAIARRRDRDEPPLASLRGATLPTVFFDGEKYWLASHVAEFLRRPPSKLLHSEFEVRQGGWVHAVLFVNGIEIDTASPRPNVEKQVAVDTLLKEPAMAMLSNREIADTCEVSHSFVASRRERLEAAAAAWPMKVASDAT